MHRPRGMFCHASGIDTSHLRVFKEFYRECPRSAARQAPHMNAFRPLVTLALSLAATCAALAQPDNLETVTKRVLAQAGPFRTLDVEYTLEETRGTPMEQRWRVRLDARTGKFRQDSFHRVWERGKPEQFMADWVVYRVQSWDGKDRVAQDALVRVAGASLGMDLQPGQGTADHVKPNLTIPYVGLYEGQSSRETLADLLKKRTPAGKLLEDGRYLIEMDGHKFWVRPATGEILRREFVAIGRNNQPYVFTGWDARYEMLGERYFPAEVTVTWGREDGTVANRQVFRTDLKSVKIDKEMEDNIFTLKIPAESNITDSRTP
jgi:hypothetical protein